MEHLRALEDFLEDVEQDPAPWLTSGWLLGLSSFSGLYVKYSKEAKC